MNQKYITEIKEEADRLMELTDNPYCQGPVSLLNGVKHVIPILLAEVERLTEENEKMKPFYKIADDTFKHWENAAYAMRDEERAKNAAKDQQIDTLKKALELICEDCSDACPAEWGAEHALCETCNSDDPKQRAKCQYDYYIQQAQEQEGKK